jgi:alpha-L-fucosidase
VENVIFEKFIMEKSIKRIRNLFLVSVILVHCLSLNAQTNDRMDKMWGESKASAHALKNGRGKFFDKSNFGMFIHWGLFSHIGGKWKGKTYYGIGEWIMNPRMAGIPVEEYKKVAEEFNPKDFDAMSIARLAKDAGMKYIIVDSKHHDGFALFDSDVDEFNIADATPFGRDPMKELAEACRETGLGFGFYYSHNQDWTTPGGTGGPEKHADGTPATFEDYFYSKCKPQVREICTNYGDLDFIWFDTPGKMKKELVEELVELVRELQPNAMLCSRVGYGLGDYVSQGDMEVPHQNIDGLWETCDTNNDSWSYTWYDNNFKSPAMILHRLISTVARGGTYLFNVGPDGNGIVPQIGQKFLREAGKWINRYPYVIYDAGSSPWGHALAWGDVTTQGNSLFLSVFEWPDDGKLYLPGYDGRIVSASLMSGNGSQEIFYQQEKGWTVFEVPCKKADSFVSVIELKLDSDVKNIDVNAFHGIYPNIVTTLLVDFADVSGAEKKSVRWMEKFGEWKKVNQVSKWEKNGKAVWTVQVFEPGFYYLDLRHKGEGKLVWRTVTDEGSIVQNQQPATEKYQTRRMGIIEFKNPGRHTISVSLAEGDAETASLESITIRNLEY